MPRKKKKDIHLDVFFFFMRARDGARGPGDLGFARTEAHFMWAETSNLRGTDVPRLHEKRTSIGCPFSCNRERETGLEPAASTLARSRSTN